MKNEKIKDLSKRIETEVRLQVYKDTVSFIESSYEVVGSYTGDIPEYDDGLCILLPAILWGLDRYSMPSPCGEAWLFNDTGNAFPELTKKIIKAIIVNPYEERAAFRLEVLKGFINKLESKL